MLRFSGSGEEANRNNLYLDKAAFAQPSGITLASGTYTYYAVPFDLYQFISDHFPLSHTITPPSTIVLSITPPLLFVSPPLPPSQYIPKAAQYGNAECRGRLSLSSQSISHLPESERGSSLMPNLSVPSGKKWSGEWSQILCLLPKSGKDQWDCEISNYYKTLS